MATTTQPSGKFITPVWVITIVFCGLAIYLVAQRSNDVTAVALDKYRVEFKPGGLIAPAGDKEAEQALQEVKKGSKPAEVEPPTNLNEILKGTLVSVTNPPATTPPSGEAPNIDGSWQDTVTRASYQISSVPGGFLLQEFSNLYGFPMNSATGRGRWDGQRFELAYNTIVGTSGSGVLDKGADGTLRGTLVDQTSGARIALNLVRN